MQYHLLHTLHLGLLEILQHMLAEHPHSAYGVFVVQLRVVEEVTSYQKITHTPS